MTRWGRFFAVLLAALLVPLVPFAVVGELPGERWLMRYDGHALWFGLTGAALLSSDVLLPVPSSLVGTLLGGRLGLVLGFCWTLLGLCAGNVVGYGVGRLLPSRFVTDLPQTPSLWVLFLSRPVPVLAEATAITAGAERVPFGHFVLATGVGNTIYAVAMAGNGAALLPAGLAGPGLILPMAVPAVGWLVWRLRRRRTPRSPM